MSIHIESRKEDVADSLIFCGDPLRAKYIAENFLDEYKMVNDVRNMWGFTGTYKGKRISVFSHGMGVPSIGIYGYELFKFYDVKKIIRVGTCGTVNRGVHMRDVILATSAYSTSSFPQVYDGDKSTHYDASVKINEKIIQTARKLDIPIKVGDIITSEVFDAYAPNKDFMGNFPERNYLGVEMEAYALFYLAYKLKREASCLLTVVDSKYDKKALSSDDRQRSLNDMILVALESLL